jgi:hypothetical protein
MNSATLIAVGLIFAANSLQPKFIRSAVERSLPLLSEAATTHIEMKSCFGCHNQGPTVAALDLAQRKGYSVSKDLANQQLKHILSFVEGNRKQFLSGTGTGGGVDTAGTILLALESVHHQPDENTDAIASYLLKADSKQEYWRCSSNRPPSEASHFATTYLAIRGLKLWARDEQVSASQKRIDAARQWLQNHPPKDTEDHVFRLLALFESEAKPPEIQKAAKGLLQLQRADGGWGQLPTLPSDAYATGTALVALQMTRIAISPTQEQQAIWFLLRSQLADGSWLVKSRSKPFQKYYESGFPHGNDQFISAAASGWATRALLGVK